MNLKTYAKIFMFLTVSSNIFAASVLENILLELAYRDSLIHGSKDRTPFNSKIECPKKLLESQKYWTKNKQYIQNGLIHEGEMENPFSTEEIKTMKNVNYHGIIGKIRGTDKVLTGGSSYSNSPGFPHMQPGCDKFFTMEYSMKELNGKACREIKFTDPVSKQYYLQVYCENSTKVYINIDPNNFATSNDCYAGKDLIHCQK